MLSTVIYYVPFVICLCLVVSCQDKLMPRIAKSFNTVEAIDEIEGRGYHHHKLPLKDPLLNPFTGCDCPEGYALIISTSAPYIAYCQKICLDQSIGCGVNLPVCTGNTIPLSNCTAAAALGPVLCPNSGAGICFAGGWTNILVFNGVFLCIQSSGNPTGSCGYGLTARCFDKVSIPCATVSLTSSYLYPLFEASCAPKKPCLVYPSSSSSD